MDVSHFEKKVQSHEINTNPKQWINFGLTYKTKTLKPISGICGTCMLGTWLFQGVLGYG